jgi:plasmid stabilization system protein ParE
MPEYILDPCVEDELWGIWHFIAQDNPDAAMRVIEAAHETFKNSPPILALAGRDDFGIPGSATSVPGAFQVLQITSFFTVASPGEFK